MLSRSVAKTLAARIRHTNTFSIRLYRFETIERELVICTFDWGGSWLTLGVAVEVALKRVRGLNPHK